MKRAKSANTSLGAGGICNTRQFVSKPSCSLSHTIQFGIKPFRSLHQLFLVVFSQWDSPMCTCIGVVEKRTQSCFAAWSCLGVVQGAYLQSENSELATITPNIPSEESSPKQFHSCPIYSCSPLLGVSESTSPTHRGV